MQKYSLMRMIDCLALHAVPITSKNKMSEVPSIVPSILTDNEEKPLRDMPCVHISLESLSKSAVGSNERDENGSCRICGFPVEKHYTESQCEHKSDKIISKTTSYLIYTLYFTI